MKNIEILKKNNLFSAVRYAKNTVYIPGNPGVPQIGYPLDIIPTKYKYFVFRSGTSIAINGPPN